MTLRPSSTCPWEICASTLHAVRATPLPRAHPSTSAGTDTWSAWTVNWAWPSAPTVGQGWPGMSKWYTFEFQRKEEQLCSFSLPSSHLLFAEQIFEEHIPVKCENSDMGCEVEQVINQLRSHEKYCQYTRTECDYKPNGCKNHPLKKDKKKELFNSLF